MVYLLLEPAVEENSSSLLNVVYLNFLHENDDILKTDKIKKV
jgi:hypothetical protein